MGGELISLALWMGDEVAAVDGGGETQSQDGAKRSTLLLGKRP
jgi:hypothetical protein